MLCTIGVLWCPEFIADESFVNIPSRFTVDIQLLMVLEKVALDISPKLISWLYGAYPSLVTPLFVQIPHLSECGVLLTLEYIKMIFDKVVEGISVLHHPHRTIWIIVSRSSITIDLQTSMSDGTQLEYDPGHQLLVCLWIVSHPCRIHIDQTP